ncbi:hypothetical protein K0M31_002201 [Melipona bicolor]|uniref:Uncharacterized protein n=1 Tax=Melipona bicolor TaxID=60889 RepID=A0AA40KYF4_9HYME|nr:hypothetical protein K0M31_002201 [Melipona bicolor]
MSEMQINKFLVRGFEIPVRSSIEIEEADEISEETVEEKSLEEEATKSEAIGEIVVGKEPDLLRQDESVQISRDSSHSCGWDEHARKRFDTAVFTLATFAAVFAVYIYIVYSLSSQPTVLHRV